MVTKSLFRRMQASRQAFFIAGKQTILIRVRVMQFSTFRPYPTRLANHVSLGEEPYLNFASRENTIARDQLYIYWLLDLGMKGYVDLPHGKVVEFYIEEESSLSFFQKYASFLQSNWEEHLQRYAPLKQQALGAVEALEKSVETEDNTGIMEKYASFNHAAYDFCQFLWSPWAVIYCIEPQVQERLAEDMDKIISLEEPIEFQKMKLELHRLSANTLVEKYGWLKVYNPYDEPYSEEEFEGMKKELNVEPEAEKRKLEENKESFLALLEHVDDASLKRKAEIVHTYAFLKTERIDTWKQLMFHLRKFYSYVAESGGISLPEACNLTSFEAMEFLRHGLLPPKSNLGKRAENQAVYFFHHNTVEVLEGWEKIESVRRRLEKIESEDMVRGLPACSGKAVGTAKIIRHSSDLQKVQRGDIFVAKFTFPTYTPYLLKCKAIVTDDGGLTSHAAIISREYGIPCIVGTKHATKVFKDGGRVEVDAFQGTARKTS